MVPRIFVSGAADGVGAAVVRHFAQRGWLVGAYDARDPDYSELAPELVGLTTIFPGQLDVTEAAEWGSALSEFAWRSNGPVNAVANCAGLLIDDPWAQAGPEQLELLVHANSTGLILGARAAASYLADSGGQLINVFTVTADEARHVGGRLDTIQSTVRSLTDKQRAEYRVQGARGVRIVDLVPVCVPCLNGITTMTLTHRENNLTSPSAVATQVWEALHPSNAMQYGHVHYGQAPRDRAYSVLTPYVSDRVVTAFRLAFNGRSKAREEA